MQLPYSVCCASLRNALHLMIEFNQKQLLSVFITSPIVAEKDWMVPLSVGYIQILRSS